MMGAILYNMNILYSSVSHLGGHASSVSWDGGFFNSATFGEVA